MTFTSLELLVISAAIETAIEDDSALRLKVLYETLNKKINDELKKEPEKFIEAIDTMVLIEPEFEKIGLLLKKMLGAAIELRNLMSKEPPSNPAQHT